MQSAGDSEAAQQLLPSVGSLLGAFSAQPPTLSSTLTAVSVIFLVGSPLLLAGLTWPAVASAYVLGTATWLAFGPRGFLIVVLYFLLGSGVTKVRLKQKEAEGIAEKRSGRRGPGSVWGSGAAGCACALLAAVGAGGAGGLLPLWPLGFVASFCTKLSDTTASEIGKAFGRTTYLVTTFRKVPRGTEGAVSLEGTAAGLAGALVLAVTAFALNLVDASGLVYCVVASQVANYLESLLGATLQDRPGYEWLTNDVVNVLNISVGAAFAMLLQFSLSTSGL